MERAIIGEQGGHSLMEEYSVRGRVTRVRFALAPLSPLRTERSAALWHSIVRIGDSIVDLVSAVAHGLVAVKGEVRLLDSTSLQVVYQVAHSVVTRENAVRVRARRLSFFLSVPRPRHHHAHHAENTNAFQSNLAILPSSPLTPSIPAIPIRSSIFLSSPSPTSTLPIFPCPSNFEGTTAIAINQLCNRSHNGNLPMGDVEG